MGPPGAERRQPRGVKAGSGSTPAHVSPRVTGLMASSRDSSQQRSPNPALGWSREPDEEILTGSGWGSAGSALLPVPQEVERAES